MIGCASARNEFTSLVLRSGLYDIVIVWCARSGYKTWTVSDYLLAPAWLFLSHSMRIHYTLAELAQYRGEHERTRELLIALLSQSLPACHTHTASTLLNSLLHSRRHPCLCQACTSDTELNHPLPNILSFSLTYIHKTGG